MPNFGASKPRVGGARAPGPPLDPYLQADSLLYLCHSTLLHGQLLASEGAPDKILDPHLY